MNRGLAVLSLGLGLLLCACGPGEDRMPGVYQSRRALHPETWRLNPDGTFRSEVVVGAAVSVRLGIWRYEPEGWYPQGRITITIGSASETYPVNTSASGSVEIVVDLGHGLVFEKVGSP